MSSGSACVSRSRSPCSSVAVVMPVATENQDRRVSRDRKAIRARKVRSARAAAIQVPRVRKARSDPPAPTVHQARRDLPARKARPERPVPKARSG